MIREFVEVEIFTKTWAAMGLSDKQKKQIRKYIEEIRKEEQKHGKHK